MAHEKKMTQWMLMLPTGRLLGPYSTPDIIKMLQDNLLSGQEKIKKVSGDKWVPLSDGPEFFETLMKLALDSKEVRSDALNKLEQETVIINLNQNQNKNLKNQIDNSNGDQEKTQVVTQEQKDKALLGQRFLTQIPRHLMNNQEADKNTLELQAPKADEADLGQAEPMTLDLADLVTSEKKALSSSKNDNKKGIALLLISVAVIIGLWFQIEDESPTDRGHLMSVQFGKKVISDDEQKKAIDKAMAYYQLDTFESYWASQVELVSLLAKSGKSIKARGLLCLVYRELWPYVTQDSQDRNIFNQIVMSTKSADPVGEYGAYCELSKLMANGRYNEARGVVDYYLNLPEHTKNPILISIKAEILGKSLEYDHSILFFDTVKNIWPHWIKIYFMKSQMALQSSLSELALSELNDLLKLNPKHKAALLQKGIIEAKFFKNYDQAIDSFTKANQINSKTSETLLVKSYQVQAEIYMAKNNPELAKKLIKMAYEKQPNNNEIKKMYLDLGGNLADVKKQSQQSELVHLGDQYSNLGDHLAAQAEFKAAFELDPKNAEAAYKAAKSLWALSQSKEAIEWLKKAQKSDPKYIEASLLLADYLSQRYDFSGALNSLNTAAKASPQSSELLKGYGIIEFRRGNLKLAVSFLQRSLKLYENDDSALILVAKCFTGLGEFEKAQSSVVKALEIDPTNPEAIVTYTKNLVQYKGVDAGIGYLKEQVKKYSYTVELRLALGEIYLSTERYSEAEKSYFQVTEFNPKSKSAWIGLGKSQQGQLKFDQAIRSFIEASIIDPSDPEGVFYLAKLYNEMGQYKKALSHYEQVISLNPLFPSVYYQAGLSAMGMGDLKKALSLALSERKANPNLADSFLLAAEIYDKNSDFAQCAKEYQGAVRLRPQGALIYVKMGRCYRMAGNIDIAENMLTIAASQESGLPDIFKEQGAIFEFRSDRAAAAASYEKYLLLSPNATDRKQVEDRILQLK